MLFWKYLRVAFAKCCTLTPINVCLTLVLQEGVTRIGPQGENLEDPYIGISCWSLSIVVCLHQVLTVIIRLLQ